MDPKELIQINSNIFFKGWKLKFLSFVMLGFYYMKSSLFLRLFDRDPPVFELNNFIFWIFIILKSLPLSLHSMGSILTFKGNLFLGFKH
jgi:hypothetical protein